MILIVIGEDLQVGRIVAIYNDIVEIGENGQLFQVRMSDLSFAPRVGDEVDVYRSSSHLRVVLADRRSGGSGMRQEGSGVNINVNQNVGPTGYVPAGQSGKVVNKVTYALLAIFLGGIGVHKFYAGQTGLGILYLLFCWTFVPEIIGLIEGIVALTKNADVYGNIVV
jgi:TM2 domain-containing membrane protein YozV